MLIILLFVYFLVSLWNGKICGIFVSLRMFQVDKKANDLKLNGKTLMMFEFEPPLMLKKGEGDKG